MEALVLDTSFKSVGVIDDFESFIWTDRYSEYGDFEIQTAPKANIISVANRGNYIYNKESDHVMIIESLNLTTDVEEGDKLLISGRSLESILLRRIVWQLQTVSAGTVDNVIRAILDKQIINSSSSRKISNFTYAAPGDSRFSSFTLSKTQYTGDNVYDVVKNLCDIFDIGFKVTLNSSNQFVFKAYYGIDRSYNQMENPHVVFSPSYENIINSDYLESETDYANVALIAGEDQGNSRKYAASSVGSSITGLNRREIFVDARDIRSEDEEGNPISSSDYTKLLQNRGYEALAEHPLLKAFDGDVETTKTYIYNQDYKLGDVIQIHNEYGYGTAMRVSEVVFSQDNNGFYITPTFRTLPT